MNKAINLQDTFLNQMRKDNIPMTVEFINGLKIKGTIKGFDNFVIIVESEGKTHLIYKHAAAYITPSKSVVFEKQE